MGTWASDVHTSRVGTQKPETCWGGRTFLQPEH